MKPLTASLSELVEGLCAYGYNADEEYPSVSLFHFYFSDRYVTRLMPTYEAIELSRQLSQLPQFKNVRIHDHKIELEKDSMHYAADTVGVVRMILLAQVEGNEYRKDQVLLVKSTTDTIYYHIDDLTNLSEPRSCMLYVSPMPTE
jgi:hypothetical protein